MDKEWFTVKECIGLPGFPTTSPAMRKRLDDLSEGKEGVKRKRTGGKAFEYHISVMPAYIQSIFSQSDLNANAEEHLNHYDTDLSDIWMMIFKLLTPTQQKHCIELFKNHGLHALLPAVVGIPEEKEILQQRNSDEKAPPAPSISTQNKKAG